MSFRWTGAEPARHCRRVSFLLALLACWFAGAPSWAAAIEHVRVEDNRIVVQFDAPIADASSFVLNGPRRIALDLNGAEPGSTVDTGGVVSTIRQGPHGEGGARVVFDLTQPALVTEGRFGPDGRELTLELRTVDNASFARAANEKRMSFLPPFNVAPVPVRAHYEVSERVPAVSHGVPLPRVYGDPGRPLVVIDPGHGGVDPGASGSGLHEKDLTLKIAREIRDQLLKSGRVRVALTRDDDRYLVLQERFAIGRRLHADLFMSIHCDSAGTDDDATGASVYTLSEVASDKEAARLAARENKADVISGIDLGGTSADISSILIDLTQRETMNASAGFAQLLGREAQPYVPMKANFHRMASLMVLKAPDMPSVLFETGYISNPRDAAFLNSVAGRGKIAHAVSDAVDVYFARRMASAN
jgi:N-acetylmuramoyl-L-alanine amidase